MTYTPHLTDGQPIRHTPPPVTLFCPECDRTFAAATRADVERLFSEHLAEVRNPDAHTPEPF